MAGAPVKFRCYRCNQLLGISRAKIGAIVSCPKCLAELVVPDPSEVPSATINAPSTTATAGGERTPASGTVDAGLSFELLDLRPEDIRVEPGFAGYVPRRPESPPRRGEPEPDEGAAAELEPREEEEPVEEELGAEPVKEPVPILIAPEPAAEPAATEPPTPTVISPAGIETIGSASARLTSGRARDVVLPRSVVAAWSLFVLMAQAISFVAGLLAGHFLWRVH